MCPDPADDRQRLEQELWHSHERFQAILETTSDGYWRVTPDGRITDVNQAYCRMIGYTRDELLAMTISQVEALDNAERIQERIAQLQKEGSLRFKTQHRTKDGRLLDLEISVTSVASTKEMLVFLRDLTDRNRTQEALFESQGRLRALVQHSWDILSILDAEGHLIYNSPACERIHGFTPEELLGRSTVDLIHPEDASRVSEAMGWLLAHPGEPVRVEYRYACKDGHWVWMEAVGVNFLDNPAIRGVVVNSRDISERRGAQEALRASEAMYRELLEHQGEGFAMVDAGECFHFANPVAERIFGVPPGGLVGRSLPEFLEEAGLQKIQAETQVRRTGRASTYELDIRRPSGERRTILVTATPRSTDAKENLQVIGVFRDITEARQAEREREQYFKLFKTASDLMAIADPNGCFKRVNPALLTTLGYDEDDLLARPFVAFIHPEDRQRTLDEMAQQMQRGHTLNFENRYLCKDGSLRWLSWQAVYVPAEGTTYATARDITALKQAESALVDSELRFQRLLEAATIPIGVANALGEIEYLNPRFLKDLAYRREDLPDMETWWQRAYPDPAYRQEALQTWQDTFARAQANGGDATMEQVFQVTGGDGQVRQMQIHAALAGDRVMVFLQDLTARVRSEESLKDALELSERLVSSQPMGIISFHAESGRCVRANEAMARMLGATVPQLLGLQFRELSSWKESGMLAAAEHVLATETEQQVEARIQTTFGKPFWFSAVLSTFHAKGDLHLLVVCEDVSARKEAESALRKAFAAVAQSPAAIVITDTKGIIEYVNTAFTRVSGYSFDESLGQNPRFLKSGVQDDAFYRDLWETVLGGGTWNGQLCNRRKDGSLFWEQATISPLRNEEGLITHLVASKLDITETLAAAEANRRLEEQLVRTQKLESLGSLAGGVAHDMNNVLGAIMGLASLHQMVQPEGSALRRDMDTIVRACERGGALVKGLLGFARQGLAEEQDVDLNGLVRDEVALLSRTTLQRVQLEMDLAPGLPPVRGDASALSHVLMNLCVNAVDAMPGGGTLSLRTSHPGAGFVALEVADTGCGMAKEVLDRALDPFFTTKPQGKGTGLGLPIVYGTVKAHKGRMEIDSLPGRGTRVSLFLPAGQTVAGHEPPELRARPEGRGLAVLLVDDDELVQDSVQQLLSALGHRPTVVASGEAALEHLERHQPTDLVILDLNMPGQGGAATLPQIRNLCPDLPVLLATGRVDQEALDLVRQIPGVTLMPKPFNLTDLRRALAPFCGG